MYRIFIEIPKKRVGITNRIRKLLKESYVKQDTALQYNVEEIPLSVAGSMKEIGITFEIKEVDENGKA